MPNSKEVRIHIVNPPIGHQSTTSKEHARRYVKAKRAAWTDDGKLRFITAEDLMAAERVGSKLVPPWMACWRTAESAVLAFEGRKAA